MTNNIYGDREIVCEVSNLDASEGVIEIENPFIYPSPGELPKVTLNKSQYGDIAARKIALRAERPLRLDTLTTMLRHREDLLLESSPLRRFHLDDYNRFPSVKEILVEIIPILNLHRENGKYSMRITVTDGTEAYRTRVGNLLVMMDGVVLTDLDMLLGFDAMLIEDVDVYQQAVVCGQVSYSGIANFITKKNYVTALTFPANVRVVDFKGVSYPVAYYGEVPEGEGDDLRQTLYWDPSMRIEAGGQKRVKFHAPGYAGRFRAVAEGIAADGTPIHHEWTFEVE
jgi:acetyltransferase-like isoleucine patch superfamily enzyme